MLGGRAEKVMHSGRKCSGRVCTKKERQGGKRFGLVRFSEKDEVERILKNLNQVWIGSHILRAFLPKFSRAPEHKGDQGGLGADRELKDGEGNETKGKGNETKGIPYAEALKGKPS